MTRDQVSVLTAAPKLPEYRKDGKAGVDRLWDSQWVNIVNAPDVLNAETPEEAVNLAVRMTEQKMAENFQALAQPSPGAVRGLVDRLVQNIRQLSREWKMSDPSDTPLQKLQRHGYASMLDSALLNYDNAIIDAAARKQEGGHG